MAVWKASCVLVFYSWSRVVMAKKIFLPGTGKWWSGHWPLRCLRMDEWCLHCLQVLPSSPTVAVVLLGGSRADLRKEKSAQNRTEYKSTENI